MILKGGSIYRNGHFEDNLQISGKNNAADGGFVDIGGQDGVIEVGNSFILPSFCDVHVHFREPGQEYKETIRTGSRAAAAGGYTDVCTMPNLKPAPSDMDSLDVQLKAINKVPSAEKIHVHPYGTITRGQKGRGQLSDMEGMAPHVIAFSDDGVGVQDAGLMKAAMETARALGKIIVAHCEDEELLAQGKSRESEWRQIERDVKLADITGASYHVCHISTKESVEIIREAKKSGVDVTCETAPHYLLLDSSIIAEKISACPEEGGKYKMNPPVREPEDKNSLIEGVLDGTVDMLATDHAPHSSEEKSRGFLKSMNGITGLECAFPAVYTGLVKTGIIPFDTLIRIMAVNPRTRFGIPADSGWTVADLDNPFVLDSRRFRSMGKTTPFDGQELYGKILYTICGDRLVYDHSTDK